MGGRHSAIFNRVAGESQVGLLQARLVGAYLGERNRVLGKKHDSSFG